MPRSRSKTPIDQRIRAERAGHRGEALAAIFLQAKLYRIRDRRYKTPLGEIDLVVQRGNMIAFVEVKARTNGDELTALEGVNTARISRAAQFWLSRHPAETGRDLRFDIIFLAPGRWPRHLIDAFSLA
jgi:putative endonuclease